MRSNNTFWIQVTMANVCGSFKVMHVAANPPLQIKVMLYEREEVLNSELKLCSEMAA